VLIGTATRTVTSTGGMRVEVALNARGRAGLRRVLSLPVRVETRASDTAGARATRTGRASLRLPAYVVVPTDGIFASGSWIPSAAGDRFLGRLRALLPDRVAALSCVGYTDDRGHPNDNLWLGERRAASVCDGLVGRGLRSGRVRTASRGEDDPRASNATSDGRALNRRVTVRIAYPG